MANLGSLTYDLVANTQRFSSGLTKAERIAKRRSRNIKAAFTGIGLAVGGLTVTLGAMVRSVTQVADQYDKLSTRLGVSVEALSELKFAADLAGVSFQTLSLGLQRSTRRIAEAAQGTGEAKDALKELGLNASALVQLSPDKQLEKIADAFLGVENSADRVRLAMKLFDSEGVSFLQLLDKGGAGLRQMRNEFAALGGTMSTEGAQRLVQFKDEMTRISAEVSAVSQALTLQLAPALIKVAEAFRDALSWAKRFFARIGIGSDLEKAQANVDALENRLKSLQEQYRTGFAANNINFIRENVLSNIVATGLELDKAKAKLKAFQDQMAVETPSADGGGGVLGTPQATAAQEAAAKAMAAKRQQMEAELQMLRDGLKTEEQLILDSHIRRIEQLATLREENIIPSQQEFLDLQLQEIQAFEDKVADFERRRTEDHAREVQKRLQAEKRELQTKEQNFRALVSSAATTSKLMFNINKLFALSDAILNFHSAVSGAYAVGAKIGGPPLGAAFAGIAAVAQGARIAAIASTSYGGGSRSDSGGGGAVPVAAADPNFGFVGAEPGASTNTEITINLGDASVFSDEAIRTLIESINDQIDDGVVIKGIVVA